MEIDDDFDYDDGWPRERIPAHDTRVIGPVHGAYHAMMRRLGMSTRQHGLDPAEAIVLHAIYRNAGCAPWEIRHEVGLHRSTLSSTLDRLERDGLIRRTASEFNGSRFQIWTTPAGNLAGGVAGDVIDDVEAEIATYTSKAQRYGARAVFEASMAIGRRERGAMD